MNKALWVVVALLMGACAAGPKPVGEAIEGSPSLNEALMQPERVKGDRVRWGGAIVKVENQAESTLVEVVARDLDERGKPRSEEKSSGRFLVRIRGFLDPEVYKQGRLFTVNGVLDDPISRTIGNYPYRYPVVNADRYHLWEKEIPYSYGYGYPYGPYYYDPFWDPWYPWQPFYGSWPYGAHSPYWW